ncbi:hypothetical protein K2173_015579 [Erythroxylum novogranatense]|uniref:Bifunctional inhibitor/plant lipid transfer protein/seed storage helical domain-containing protein n=1 Tax=Erythroxylum novogranatense TaxID=1862640 RepID=A0AAV8SEH8_9ROSI|nr:hypothetical protein K2173_015579 [Erythroxylum novogranatense]
MKKMARDLKKRILCGMVAYLAVVSIATIQDDEQECAEQLGNLAACIPFVSGTANKPTPECCQDTQKVKANKPKCLCVLIKESTDPSMGLPVNTTLALQMPSACNIDAKVSDCPTILNLPPDSPDAKIFREAGSSDATTTTSTTDSPPTTASPGSSSSSSSSTPDSNSKTTPSSNGVAKTKLSADCIIMALAFAAWLLI